MKNIYNVPVFKLKHKYFVVLGLISERMPKGCHAYDINKRIDERGMRNWTNIGIPSRSSLYNILENLERDRLLDSHTEEVDNRIRKIYIITDLGYKILKKRTFDVIYNFNDMYNQDFDMAFSMYPILSYKEQIKAFTSALNIVKEHKKSLKQTYDEDIHWMVNVKGLFIRPIKIYEAHIDFFNWVLEEIEKGEGQVGSKTYGK